MKTTLAMPATLAARRAAVPAARPVTRPAAVRAVVAAVRRGVVSVGRLAAVVAVLLAVLPAFGWWEAPASASVRGGWAVTYLDPPPEVFGGGKSYTVGFWVLQHGTHPYVGKLDPVGLRLTRADGRTVTFPGTPLPEPGHYATSVAVPDGVWKVAGVQGWFEPYAVGTLTVPGRLVVDPVPQDKVATFGGDGKDPWGAVRPPGFPMGKSAPVLTGGEADSGGSATTAVPSTEPPGAEVSSMEAPGVGAEGGGAPGGRVPAYALLPAAVGGALVVLVAIRLPRLVGRSRRPGRKDGDQGPAGEDGSSETLVIGG
ncbi:hypothetical protein [Nonomuraea sp. NPDC052265]|uniref:hypothetical protein n=1 Tax=Nonomuraea sp. NPDC052265 TaxID=3364374 RepID=UPI0037C6165B